MNGRKALAAALTISAVLAMASCTGRPDPPPRAQPELIPPIESPLPLERFEGDSCSLYTNEQLVALHYLGRDGQPDAKPVEYGCSWSGDPGNAFSVSAYPPAIGKTREYFATTIKLLREKKSPASWRQSTIDGYAMITDQQDTWCEAEVAVTEDKYLNIVFYAEKGPSNPDRERGPYLDDPCGGAEKAAEFAIANLRAG